MPPDEDDIDLDTMLAEVENELDAAPDAQTDDAPGSEIDDAPQIPDPLDHWSLEEKQRYADVPDELKPRYIDLHKDFDRRYDDKFKAIADQQETLTGIDQIFSPLDPMLSNQGLSRLDVMRQMVGWHQAMQQDPYSALPRLAQAYGVDWPGFAPDDGASEPGYSDPRITGALQSQGQALQGMQGMLQDSQIDTQLRLMELERNPDNSPLYPHLGEIRETMKAALRLGHQDPKTLYDQLVYANPTTRRAMLEAEQKRWAEDADKKRKEAVKKADQANRSAVQSAGEPTAPAKSKVNGNSRKDIAADVEAAWDAMQG